jgi:uncharacterized protein YjeT (DUF2065 family)
VKYSTVFAIIGLMIDFLPKLRKRLFTDSQELSE